MRVKSRWTCAWSWLASVVLALGLSGTTTWAASSGDFVTTDTRFWVDTTGRATIEDVARVPADAIQALERPRSFEIDRGALWLRYPLPALDPARRWYLVLEGGAFTNRATLYTPTADGQWRPQEAGDHLPVSSWSHPDRMPVFTLEGSAGTVVWLRLENHPAPLSPSLRLQDERDLQLARDRSLLSLGIYLGFGLLVLFLGWVHVRLYGDRVFLAYVAYVTCMLGFQIAFTGTGRPLLLAEPAALERRGARAVHALAHRGGDLVRARGQRALKTQPASIPAGHGMVPVRLHLSDSLFLLPQPGCLQAAEPVWSAVGSAELRSVHLGLAQRRDLCRLDRAGLPAAAPGLPVSGAAQRRRPAGQLGHAIRRADRLGAGNSAAALHPAPARQGLQREPRTHARHRQHRSAHRPDRAARAAGAPARCHSPRTTQPPGVCAGARGTLEPRRNRRGRGPR